MTMPSEGITGVTGLGDYVELAREVGKPAVKSSVTSKHNVVIGVNLSNNWMKPFDYTALQDDECKYVESIQWVANGGGNYGIDTSRSVEKVFLPIVEVNASSAASVDKIVSSLAAEDIIIPKVSILPTKLSCRVVKDNQSGKETFDLVLLFQLKKSSSNPEEWANWSLQFLHNQLYDSFATLGAQQMTEPFQIMLARGIVWKTDEHMKDFLAHSERILHTWNKRGPKYLGSMSEEIYLLKNGVASNYFKHNMTGSYTSKVNRCLISNVVNKVSVDTDVTVPAVAWYMVDAVTSGVKAINTIVSPLVSSASERLQSDDMSSGVFTFAEEASIEKLKHFNYDLYFKARSKNINIKGISQEQLTDHSLKMDLKLHPKMFCTKLVGDSKIILGKGRDGKYRIVVPKSLKDDVMKVHHDCLVNPTKKNNFETVIYDTFTWNGIHKDVKQYIEASRRKEAGKVIHVGDSCSRSEPNAIVPVINEDKKKWWKSLVTKKGYAKKDTSDAPPALVKLSTCSVSTASGLSSSHGRSQPSVTEEIHGDDYRLIAEMPGVNPENLKVDFFQGGRVLKVSGTQQISNGKLSETNQFEKCFAITEDLNTGEAVARLSNGVLIVTVPRA